MTRNLKALGLALVAVFAMGAVMAQGASATEKEHEFHADGERTVVTGTNDLTVSNGAGGTKTELSSHSFKVGEAGTVTCNKVETESTQIGTKVSEGTYQTDQITVTPHYSECTFGGNPATVNFNHCAFVFDSDTTTGNPTGGEHANVEIECAKNAEGVDTEIEITTSICTLTVPTQTIKHAVRYENDPHSKSAINVIATAHKVKVGKKNDKAGCALVPTGEVGTYTGTVTASCTRDDGSTLEGTETTTPTGKTVEGPTTECTVSNT